MAQRDRARREWLNEFRALAEAIRQEQPEEAEEVITILLRTPNPSKRSREAEPDVTG